MLIELNNWIANHQALVATVGLPLLTLVVTQIATRSSEQKALSNARIDRKLQVQLKMADFRREWIEEMRTELAEFNAIIADADSIVDIDSKVPFLISVFQMKINDEEELGSNLISKIADAGDSIFISADTDEEKVGRGNVHHELCEAGRAYLKAEWSRLNRDLEAIDSISY
ncbi:hypothetical protein [Amylibacter sp. IMCC11727]|uniref:hypothetical protein n=1 Tax=Amylibacter sp. IMCC11727 TaxID=3039851 RepID=UPI00244DBEDC|nr:hypothetical protein [Amylibacter sp. IMCC11727]WGI21297.1 hypothetical protein QBD29_14430 [Amylibacter sp. IMCC11727]